MGREDGLLGDVAGCLGCLKCGEQNLPVHGLDDLSRGGLCGDRKAEYAQGVGACRLVEAVELVSEGLDLHVPRCKVGTEGLVLEGEGFNSGVHGFHCCFNVGNLLKRTAQEIQLGVHLGNGGVHDDVLDGRGGVCG